MIRIIIVAYLFLVSLEVPECLFADLLLHQLPTGFFQSAPLLTFEELHMLVQFLDGQFRIGDFYRLSYQTAFALRYHRL